LQYSEIARETPHRIDRALVRMKPSQRIAALQEARQ
jgi:hypothetical protein